MFADLFDKQRHPETLPFPHEFGISIWIVLEFSFIWKNQSLSSGFFVLFRAISFIYVYFKRKFIFILKSIKKFKFSYKKSFLWEKFFVNFVEKIFLFRL